MGELEKDSPDMDVTVVCCVRNDFLQLLLDSANEMAKEEIAEDDSEDIAINYKDESSNHSVFKNISTKQISMDELIAQCVIFFLAGYHTTATALAISTYMLAIHQDEQNKVFQELSDALQETNGEVTYEALQKMKHLDNVISETMRLYPPATRTERRAEADYPLRNTDITIPKGMIVTIPMYAMHRDPTYFPNPEKFDPDRFLPERREQIIPYSYLPFGAGPRNCVGMRFALLEMKLCLVYVLSIFKVEKSSLTKVPLEFKRGAGLLRPKPIFIRLTKRDNPPIKI